ncbi:peptidase M4 [Halalkalibacillus halophilus]|uniref:peptidase M4 n=1 Tax=Halalkalibacillus halophilus TaxID=392827 RepID=UPI0004025580|nr:peptidase M4 [Halalkalibacillus halophilus]
MKWYKLAVPAAIGISVGAVIGKKVRDEWIIPEVALKRVKEQFKEHGPISGSWILMKKEDFEQDGKIYQTYRGGVSRNIDGETLQYNFVADATNGNILDTAEYK